VRCDRPRALDDAADVSRRHGQFAGQPGGMGSSKFRLFMTSLSMTVPQLGDFGTEVGHCRTVCTYASRATMLSRSRPKATTCSPALRSSSCIEGVVSGAACRGVETASTDHRAALLARAVATKHSTVRSRVTTTNCSFPWVQRS
jgi:hypothetical protein